MKKLYSTPDCNITTFKWRSQDGRYWTVHQMDTRHLFFTLRMIWNHTAPVTWRFIPYKRYDFSDYYTTEYMRNAVIMIINELVKRDDIVDIWQVELDQMIARLNNAHLKEVNDQKNTTQAIAN